MLSWQGLTLMFVAGGMGTLARFGLTVLVSQALGRSFPWGTWTVNLLGCLLFGFIWSLFARHLLSDANRVILLVGFMGSFTTFSAYIFESFTLGGSSPLLLLLNVTGQVVAGFAAMYAGICLGKLL